MNSFESQKIYFGVYSMSGIAVRLGYGYGKDPFGSSYALMPK